MALTQTDVDNLEAALAQGVLEVETEGRKVKYDSAAALMRRLEYVRAAVASAAGTRRTMLQPVTFTRD